LPKLLGQKGTVIGVGVVGIGVAGYMVYRYKKKSDAAAAAATAQAQTTATSGYGYGAAAGYGYGAGAFPGGYYGYGDGYGYGASGGFNPTGYYGYGVTEPQGPVANTTNAQWAQAAINQLTQEQYDPQTVSAALGAYELGQPVTAAQETIINSAIGIEGYPPVPGANGYPPAIQVQGTTGGGGGGGQTGTITVPNVVGEKGEDARKEVQAVGLKASQSPGVPKGKTSVVKSQTPKAGSQVKSGSTVTMTLTIK
jgi:hypothetical protein